MARYKDAVDWIAHNDDTEWTRHGLDDPSGWLSVTAALVADLFEKDPSVVRADIIKALKRKENGK